MKKFFLFFLFFNLSCNLGVTEDSSVGIPLSSKSVELRLSKELSDVGFSIPIRYDTSFSWIHYSDCGNPCDKKKYRFQSKRFPIFKESGWFWDNPSDSIDQFTISYSMDIFLRNDDTTQNPEKHNFVRKRLLSEQESTQLILDTLEKINDRYFSIFVLGEPSENKTKRAFAITTIKGNEVTFLFEQLRYTNSKNQDDFIKESINYFKTIKIKCRS